MGIDPLSASEEGLGMGQAQVPYTKPELSAKDERPVVLITTVDIGGGKTDKIELRKGDSPEDVARLFCEKHNIPTTVLGPLTAHIMDNLRKSLGRRTADSLRSSKAAPSDEPLEERDSNGVASPPTPAGPGLLEPAVEEEEEDEEEEEERDSPPAPLPAAEPEMIAPHPRNTAATKLSFADGMTDTLYQQLSAKLLPVDNSRNGSLLTVANGLNTAGPRPMSSRNGMNSNRASSVMDYGFGKSHSAEPSPRGSTAHLRLYANAVDQRNKLEARRKMQVEEEVATTQAARSSIKMKWISAEMMKDRTAAPFSNYGERLYAEGVEAAAMRKSKVAAARVEREQAELSGATFMPEISRLAAALWSGADLDSQPAWARLSVNKQAKTLEHIQQLRTAREKAEMQECTFRPKINRTSIAMMSDRSEAQKMLSTSTHEQLFADAVRRQQKLEALAQWLPDDATFRPAVNNSASAQAVLRRSMEKLSDEPTSPRGGSDVVERLYQKLERTKARLEEKRKELEATVDPATGQRLFVPEVGRAPRPNSAAAARMRTRGQGIGEHLYSSGVDALNRKEAALEAVRQAEREVANARKASAKSERLFNSLRAKRFSQIFEYLDESGVGVLDLVGLVRFPSVHMDNLDIEVREDVEAAAAIAASAAGVPLMPRGSSASGGADAGSDASLTPVPPLDLATFSAYMEQALHLKRKPRAYLVPSPSAKQQPMPTFKPTINARSKELAARARPADLPAHELLHMTGEQMRAKLEAARRDADAAAVADCTFAPRLNAPMVNGRVVGGKALRAAGAASQNGSAPGTPRSVQSDRHGSISAVNAGFGGNSFVGANTSRAAGGAHAQGAEMEQFLALEQEVQEALEGVTLAQERLGVLEGVQHELDDDESSEEPEVAGGEYDEEDEDGFAAEAGNAAPADIAATEALLLEMLAGAAAPVESGTGAANATDEAAVEAGLQQYLASAGSSGRMNTTGGSGALVAINSNSNSNGRLNMTNGSTTLMASISSSGTRHAAQASSGDVLGNQQLEELANSLSQWDHLTAPATGGSITNSSQ